VACPVAGRIVFSSPLTRSARIQNQTNSGRGVVKRRSVAHVRSVFITRDSVGSGDGIQSSVREHANCVSPELASLANHRAVDAEPLSGEQRGAGDVGVQVREDAVGEPRATDAHVSPGTTACTFTQTRWRAASVRADPARRSAAARARSACPAAAIGAKLLWPARGLCARLAVVCSLASSSRVPGFYAIVPPTGQGFCVAFIEGFEKRRRVIWRLTYNNTYW
jgi:hypothetical protein